MAQKRMFDKRITESDRFTDLPNSSKALYFMAGMSADDKGFFQPRRLQKACGFSDDDFKILIAKNYFISFPSGVMVVTDWNKNNWLDKRRITETEYIDELKLLKIINEKYELKSENELSLTNAKPMLSQNSIEENSIEENSIEENSSSIEDNNNIFSLYENEIGTLNSRQYQELDNFRKLLSDELVIEAINKTADSKGKCFAYLRSILKTWIQKGYKTLGDIQNESKENKKGIDWYSEDE